MLQDIKLNALMELRRDINKVDWFGATPKLLVLALRVIDLIPGRNRIEANIHIPIDNWFRSDHVIIRAIFIHITTVITIKYN